MLIIEDGTGKPDADSYSTAAELVSYAARYGVTIPAEEAAQETLLRRAALAMDGMKWKGCRANGDQALAWPRRGVNIDGENKPSDYIPARIQYGQMALAGEIHADDIDPIETRKGAVIRRVNHSPTSSEPMSDTPSGMKKPAFQLQAVEEVSG